MIPNHVVNELFHSSHFLITLKYQQSIHIQKYTDVYMIYIYILTYIICMINMKYLDIH